MRPALKIIKIALTMSVALFVLCLNASSQFDTEFRMPPIWNTGGATHNTPSELFITTPSPFMVDVHIETADGITFVLDTTVVSGTPLKVPLTPVLGQTDVANEVNTDRGLIITSTSAIQCVHKISGTHNQTLVTLKGENGLGTDFWAGSQVRNMNANYSPEEYHFISVMATDDNTTISIETPFNMYLDGSVLPNPFILSLNKDESYLIRGHNPVEHVAGSHITSDKNIVAISGSTHTRIAGGNAADGGTDQLVPIELMWKDFVVVKGNNNDPFDYAIIVATEDNTNIYLDDGNTPVGTINAGEYYDYTLAGNMGDAHYLRTDKRAYCYHFTGSSQDDEVGMSAIPQMDCTGSRYIEFSLFQVNTDSQTMNLIVPAEAESTLQLNGVDYQSVPSVLFTDVPGLPGWKAVTFPLASLQSNNVVTSEGFFHAGFLTGNGGATGTYGFLSGFDDAFEFIDPASGVPATIYTLGPLCPGENLDHCLQVFSCGSDHNIISFEGNEGTIVLTPPSEPYDTCFRYTAPFDFVGNDTVTFVVDNLFGFEGSIDIVFTIVDPETPINAGPSQGLCAETTATLTAINPDLLVPGSWSILGGNGTVVTPNSPTSLVTGLGLGINTFLWQQFYPCETNQALTQITVYDGQAPPAMAGEDVELCSNNNLYFMQANDPGITGTGTWSIQEGSGTVFNISDNNAQVVNLGIGQNIFTWTIDNGPCAGGPTVDEMTIFVFTENHPAANAGVDQIVCSGGFNQTSLTGSLAVFPAEGTWTLVSGAGTIISENTNETTVTNLGVGVNVFEWSIDNGPCETLTDLIEVVVYDTELENANAGDDAEYCTPTSSHTLSATPLTGPAEGSWSVSTGDGTFSNENDPNAIATNLSVGTNTFVWTVYNGGCANDGSSDEITVTIFDASQEAAAAGENQDLCVDVFTFAQLEANEVEFPAQGEWTVPGGTATFSDENDPFATVSNLPVGETVLVWTIDNGPCAAPTVDEVTITIYNDTLAPANAGDDAAYCTPISTHTMNAINPTLPAMGLWTLESGTGTIASVNSPVSAISGLGVGANVFRWTIQNGPCPGAVEFDEITLLIFDENAPVANAGPDQEHCSNPVGLVNTFLNANTPIFPATGEWTLISGGGIIGDAANPLSAVTDLPVGENIFQWTYENTPCAEGATTDLVSVFVFNVAQFSANAGVDQDICNDDPTATLNANPATFPATGEWVLASGSGNITNATDPSTSVTEVGLGVNVFEWTINNGVCDNAITSDQMLITVYEEGLSSANAGADQSVCSGTGTVLLDGNVPILPASGEWILISGSGTFTNDSDANTSVTNLTIGLNVFEWNLDNGACSGNTSDQVTITVFDAEMPPANAGGDQSLCLPVTSSNMTATTPVFPATGTWVLVSGAGGFVDNTDPSTEVTGLGVGENIFRWSVTNAPCSPATTLDLVSIFLYDNALAANAGADQAFCSPVASTSLNGNTPIYPATGAWTLVSGSGNISNPSNPNSLITGLGLGDNIFQWTITNGPCAGSPLTDSVTITIFNTSQTAANAGNDQQVCTPATSTSLVGNNAVYPASGEWIVVSGTATIVNPENPNTLITNLSVGTIVLEWTISNGPCLPALTADQVTIEVLDSGAETADAGSDQDLCLPTSTATLDGNFPVAPATGGWVLISGAGSIVNPTSPTSIINGLAVGVNVFQWSINNGDCGGISNDTVTITLYSNNSPNANAGDDQNLCTPQLETLLEGNTPVFPATGEWTLISGSGAVEQPSNPNSEVTGLSIGENTFEWTLVNGPCANAATANQVSIFVFDGGAPQAEAGANQELCTPANLTFMNALPAVDPGTGEWTLLSGTGNIVTSDDPNSEITGLSIGQNVFLWTLDYSTCGVQEDEVTITVFDASLPAANAGPDLELCSPNDAISLLATDVAAPAVGTWTLISGNGEINNVNNPNASIENLTIGENTFVWSVYNGNCLLVEDQTDTMSVFVFDLAQLDANAGPNQELCTPVITTNLEGSIVLFPSLGEWTLVSGGGNIVDPNDPQTEVNNLSVGENTFEWTVDNGACVPDVTSDLVSIFVFDQGQASADAGNDQELCTPVDVITFDGNPVTFPAQGTWTLIQGSGDILDLNNPNSAVTNLSVGENIFGWTINNGPCGTPTQDFVSIFIFGQFSPDADAGEDQERCSPVLNTTLNGNTPDFPSTGTWTLQSGAGTILSQNNPNTAVVDLAIGENVFVWTVTNGPCDGSLTTDTMTVFVFDPSAPLAQAGDDQELCTPTVTATMDANSATFPGTGTWTLIQGSGDITDENDPNTTISGLSVGENTFEWSLYNGPCAMSGSSDLISVFVFDEFQADANAGPDQQLCTPQESTTLAANGVTFPATGFWTLIEGGATITDIDNQNSLLTNIELGNNVLVWTIENGPCDNALTTDTVVVSLFAFDAEEAEAGADQEFCLPITSTFLDATVLIGAAEGTWEVVTGSGSFANENDPITEVTGLAVGVNTFSWNVDNGPCGFSVDEVLVRIFDPEAPEAEAGEDQFFCTPISTAVLEGNTPATPGTGTWTLTQGMGTIDQPSDVNSALSGLTIGENIFCWTIYNGPCEEPTTNCVSIFIYDENHPDADAGNDIELCLPTNATVLGATPAIFPAFGTWERIDGAGTVSDNNDPNTAITDLELGINTFVWTINNEPCSNGVTADTVSVFVFQEGVDPASAGNDQSFCSPISSTTLFAAPLDAPNTGTWTLVNGNGVLDNPTSENTVISGLTVGENTFQWTVYNGPCENTESSDQVSVFIYDQNQLAANANADQELCLPIDNTFLDANFLIFPASGEWTLVSGTATIVDPTNPNTQVTDLGLGTNVFEWTITNGPCEDGVTSDSMSVLVFSEDAALADAGDDIDICTPESQVTLDAVIPDEPATGTWSIVDGGGSLSDVNDPNAIYSGLTVGEHVLQWTIYNGPCSNNNSFDFVTVSVYDATSPIANAGPDQEFCAPDEVATMAADIPVFPSVGTWTLISGNASISDVTDPNAVITGLQIGESILQWSISNGPCESASIDAIMITVYNPDSPDAYAGEDLEFCTPFGGTALEANLPLAPADGTWTLISGEGTITNQALPNTTLFDLGFGENIFVWSIYNGPCANGTTTDTLSVFLNNLAIAGADAGPDQAFCGVPAMVQMAGSETIGNTAFGEWTIIEGSGSIANVNNEFTQVFDVPIGVNTFVWTVDNGFCGVSADTMQVVIYDPELPPAYAGEDLTLCEDDFIIFNLQGNEAPWPATGTWDIIEGPVEITDLTDNETTVWSLGEIDVPFGDVTSSMTWTIDNGVCGTSMDTVVFVVEDCLTIEITDAFSPNGDGINDFFVIPNLYKYPNNNIQIFNRWGALIYSANPYNNNWDGKSDHPSSIGDVLPVSTYYYILDLGDGSDPLNGYILLKR
jgi:gliding motility-associated-like protein